MVTVYIETKDAQELTPSLVFWPNFKFEISPKRLFLREIMEQYKKPFFEIVSDVSLADFVAAPYEYFEMLRYAPAYLKRVYALAQSANKKVLLFDYSDHVDKSIQIPDHAILFRVSCYRHHKKHNEIIMPYFVEDMRASYAIEPKGKSESCVVGYCGQSQFQNARRKARASLKWILFWVLLCARRDKEPLVHKLGTFLRSEALSILRKGGVATSFIERPFYSLHRSTMPLDPREVRHEYVENLRECDLALSVRGGANASQRFYETLSASRIPLFLDTDCVLPLEEIIQYDEVLLRVLSRELSTLSERASAWFTIQSPESFLLREKRARKLYDEYLRLDKYFAIVFDSRISPYRNLLLTKLEE
ncbi:MAG TPA: hypothetical protein DEF00_02075 [Candidatus Taylorbacteria bacterium]|nr:MAG: Exostosin family protein [Parcubacteria group bacterium GW2011_GWA2_47_64]KKU96504.1 MAG: Exostosin family protein [Parcubacteria group bacterium GW2011_GWC2_48_17]HBV01164.1 hypothetical protein [Candidatus Taylorbacteria bacterium]